jgi:cell division septum initiation protein DivIVA
LGRLQRRRDTLKKDKEALQKKKDEFDGQVKARTDEAGACAVRAGEAFKKMTECEVQNVALLQRVNVLEARVAELDAQTKSLQALLTKQQQQQPVTLSLILFSLSNLMFFHTLARPDMHMLATPIL